MDTSGYHIDTVARIQDALIDSYTVDFPDAYQDLRHETREAMREQWFAAYLKPLTDLLENDLLTNGSQSMISRYERSNQGKECLTILEYIKEALYPTYIRKEVSETVSNGKISSDSA